MGELEEILNTYKRFPDVPLVLGDPEARLLITALEEAWRLLREIQWSGLSGNHKHGWIASCLFCGQTKAWGHLATCPLTKILRVAEER